MINIYEIDEGAHVTMPHPENGEPCVWQVKHIGELGVYVKLVVPRWRDETYRIEIASFRQCASLLTKEQQAKLALVFMSAL